MLGIMLAERTKNSQFLPSPAWESSGPLPAARTKCPCPQAAHLQAGEQVAAGLHWHMEPHWQFGPQAHDVAPFWVSAPAAALANSTLLDEFI